MKTFDQFTDAQTTGDGTGAWINPDNIRDDKMLAFMVLDENGGTSISLTLKVQGRLEHYDGSARDQYSFKNFDETYFPTSSGHSADEGPYSFFSRLMQDADGNDIAGKYSLHYFLVKGPEMRVNLTALSSTGNTPKVSAQFID